MDPLIKSQLLYQLSYAPEPELGMQSPRAGSESAALLAKRCRTVQLSSDAALLRTADRTGDASNRPRGQNARPRGECRLEPLAATVLLTDRIVPARAAVAPKRTMPAALARAAAAAVPGEIARTFVPP